MTEQGLWKNPPLKRVRARETTTILQTTTNILYLTNYLRDYYNTAELILQTTNQEKSTKEEVNHLLVCLNAQGWNGFSGGDFSG